MTTLNVIFYDWTPESMVEVILNEPDDFLKIKETLTRMGIASMTSKVLYQTCNILHKQGKYFIVHFKELFALDNKEATLTVADIERRNTIIKLLSEWGLVQVVDKSKIERSAAVSSIKIIPFKDKASWELKSKYTIGLKKAA